MSKTYPQTWPKPDRERPSKLASRITELQKQALYDREITTRDLAKELGVHERYLSAVFPGKVPIVSKKPLIEARNLYKMSVAEDALAGKYTRQEAAKIANVTYKTLLRYVQKVKARKAKTPTPCQNTTP